MLKRAAIFGEKARKEMNVDLSDEELFDMGPYNLNEENLLQPNAQLKNLFGGPQPLVTEELTRLRNESELHSESSKDKIQFSDDDEQQSKKPFNLVYSIKTTLDYAERHNKKFMEASPSRFLRP